MGIKNDLEKEIKKYEPRNWFSSAYGINCDSQQTFFAKGPDGEDITVYAFLGLDPVEGYCYLDMQYMGKKE